MSMFSVDTAKNLTNNAISTIRAERAKRLSCQFDEVFESIATAANSGRYSVECSISPTHTDDLLWLLDYLGYQAKRKMCPKLQTKDDVMIDWSK